MSRVLRACPVTQSSRSASGHSTRASRASFGEIKNADFLRLPRARSRACWARFITQSRRPETMRGAAASSTGIFFCRTTSIRKMRIASLKVRCSLASIFPARALSAASIRADTALVFMPESLLVLNGLGIFLQNADRSHTVLGCRQILGKSLRRSVLPSGPSTKGTSMSSYQSPPDSDPSTRVFVTTFATMSSSGLGYQISRGATLKALRMNVPSIPLAAK